MTGAPNTMSHTAGRVCYPTRRDAALGTRREAAARDDVVRRPWFPGNPVDRWIAAVRPAPTARDYMLVGGGR